MSAVRNMLLNPAGQPVPAARVAATLIGGAFLDDGTAEIVGYASTITDSTGAWTLDLTPTGDYADTGAYYRIRELAATWSITVPDGAGPHQLYDLLVDPAPTPSSYLGLTRAEADAAYAAIVHEHTPDEVGFLVLAVGAPVPGGTPAGTVIIRV